MTITNLGCHGPNGETDGGHGQVGPPWSNEVKGMGSVAGYK